MTVLANKHRILDVQFLHLFVVMLFEKTKINEREAENGPFYKKRLRYR